MGNFRMGRKPRDIALDNPVWQEACMAGRIGGSSSERVSGYIIGTTWSQRCAIYDPKLKRITYMEHR